MAAKKTAKKATVTARKGGPLRKTIGGRPQMRNVHCGVKCTHPGCKKFCQEKDELHGGAHHCKAGHTF